MKKAQDVYLASDPDREGEAIAWHLARVLDLDIDKTNRIVFHEVTKPAVLEALDHPTHIDMNLVRSQETRRMLDRIIGFKLSKLLQNKIQSKSAGRVQSVALRLIVERENEIKSLKLKNTGPFMPMSKKARLDLKPYLPKLMAKSQSWKTKNKLKPSLIVVTRNLWSIL